VHPPTRNTRVSRPIVPGESTCECLRAHLDLPTRMSLKGHLLAGLLLIASAVSGAQRSQPRRAVSVDDVISWLPPDIETLVVARGPIDLGRSSEEFTDLADILAHTVVSPLSEYQKGDVLRSLRAGRLRFAVEGSRAFGAPSDLGLGPYQGCHVLVFEESDSAIVDRFMTQLAVSGGTSLSVDGFHATRVRWRMQQDDWSVVVVRPRPSVVVIATTEQMLRELLDRAAHARGGRALPATLPEWAGVDTTSRVWAIRHFARERNGADPTSPITTESRPSNAPDTLAIGLAITIGRDKPSGFVARYYSRNPRANEIARRMWEIPREGLTPSFTVERAGVVRIAAAPKEDRGVSISSLILLAVLGHAIYI
jgi:hypothetical protein